MMSKLDDLISKVNAELATAQEHIGRAQALVVGERRGLQSCVLEISRGAMTKLNGQESPSDLAVLLLAHLQSLSIVADKLGITPFAIFGHLQFWPDVITASASEVLDALERRERDA